MWIRDNIFEYKISSRPTRREFQNIVNIIVNNKYSDKEIEDVVSYCKNRNTRFNEEIFYKAIEDKYAMLD
tara:strand:- start:295 stop:504 length:210 start_codon:yes stop_codon:yes gene_type:complete